MSPLIRYAPLLILMDSYWSLLILMRPYNPDASSGVFLGPYASLLIPMGPYVSL